MDLKEKLPNAQELQKTWEIFALGQSQIAFLNPVDEKDKVCCMRKDFESFVREFSSFFEGRKVYFRLNPAKEQDCNKWSRQWQCDSDISHRQWVLIDIDAQGHDCIDGATDEELEIALGYTNSVLQVLKDEGFPQPIVAFSGNGYHLLYKFDAAKGNGDVKSFLSSLGYNFNLTQVDLRVYNLARFTRFYGTINPKGGRQSKILSVPEQMSAIDADDISAFLEKYPAPKEGDIQHLVAKNGKKLSKFQILKWTEQDDEFLKKFLSVYESIPKFLSQYNLYLRSEDTTRGEKHILSECPYQKHKNPHEKDAVIFDNHKQIRYTVFFSCRHETCGWDAEGNDLPGDKKFIDFVRYVVGDKEFERLFGEKEQQTVSEEKNPKFVFNLTKRRKAKQEFFSTGYQYLDSILGGGLVQRGLTIISGKAASGKSTFLNNIIWNTNSTCKSVVFTEQHTDDVCTNLAKTYYAQPTVSEEERETALSELEGNLVMYSKDSEETIANNWRGILSDVSEFLDSAQDFKIVYLDNLSILCPYNADNTKEQQEFACELVKIAETKNVNITLVVHPSKTGETVCGTSLFENLASQVLEVENRSDATQKIAKLRVLKNRENGNRTDCFFIYDNNRLNEYRP